MVLHNSNNNNKTKTQHLITDSNADRHGGGQSFEASKHSGQPRGQCSAGPKPAWLAALWMSKKWHARMSG